MSTADEAEGSGEDRFIARYFRPLARNPGAFGLIDDAAILTPPAGHDVVLTADAIVGDVHFFRDDPGDAVARKALRVNLSDLAAKGAEPAGFLLSLALPEATGETWIAAFAQGLGDDAERYGCPLLGGDSVRTGGPAMISIAAFGLVPHGAMVARSGARAGDVVMVSGTIGDAALGLLLRRQPERTPAWAYDPAMRAHLAARYLVPEPRNAIAAALRTHASAAMDVSDGLVGDLAKLCRASSLAADIAAPHVPLSGAARQALAADPGLMETMLTGGDDYEVLCTVAPERVASFQAAAAAAQVTVAALGTMRDGQGAHFRDADDKPMRFAKGAYSHF
jgi:thiamine-monophosphate kinase